MKRGARDAGTVQQRDGRGRDERGLFGGFRQHRIARGERGGDLADEDRQREIPRCDAHQRAARCRVGKLAPSLRCVVAAKIGRFADFSLGVRERLAGFAHCQRKQCAALLLEQIGGGFQTGRALGGGGTRPGHAVR